MKKTCKYPKCDKVIHSQNLEFCPKHFLIIRKKESNMPQLTDQDLQRFQEAKRKAIASSPPRYDSSKKLCDRCGLHWHTKTYPVCWKCYQETNGLLEETDGFSSRDSADEIMAEKNYEHVNEKKERLIENSKEL